MTELARDTSIALPLLAQKPADAAQLLAARFAAPLLLSEQTALQLPDLLAGLDIAGGATYDALVVLAARDHAAALATLDARARDSPVVSRLGVRGPGRGACEVVGLIAVQHSHPVSYGYSRTAPRPQRADAGAQRQVRPGSTGGGGGPRAARVR